MPFTSRKYTNPNRWTPRHYGDELHEMGDSGRDTGVTLLEAERPLSVRENACQAWVRCPGCSRRVRAYALVDVRHVPDDLSDGQDWACDGCWTTWIRPDGAGPNGPRTQNMSEPEWAALHGAPKQVVDHLKTVHARRKAKGQKVAIRIPERVDLDSIPARARMPEEMRDVNLGPGE